MAIDLDRADALAHTVIHAVKTLRGLRQHLPKPAVGVDHSAYPVLFRLAQEPARVSAIAEAIESDVSTVSRQASQLIDAGLAVRVSDPDDGRAHLVELTPTGHEAITRSRELRAEFFRSALKDWSAHEVDEFIVAMDRLRTDLLATSPSSRKENA